jgi:hypothetical protein
MKSPDGWMVILAQWTQIQITMWPKRCQVHVQNEVPHPGGHKTKELVIGTRCPIFSPKQNRGQDGGLNVLFIVGGVPWPWGFQATKVP